MIPSSIKQWLSDSTHLQDLLYSNTSLVYDGTFTGRRSVTSLGIRNFGNAYVDVIRTGISTMSHLRLLPTLRLDRPAVFGPATRVELERTMSSSSTAEHL